MLPLENRRVPQTNQGRQQAILRRKLQGTGLPSATENCSRALQIHLCPLNWNCSGSILLQMASPPLQRLSEIVFIWRGSTAMSNASNSKRENRSGNTARLKI